MCSRPTSRRTVLGFAATSGIAAVAGCSDDTSDTPTDRGTADPTPPDPTSADPSSASETPAPEEPSVPADLSTSQRSEYRYGEHPRQVSDLWLPRGERREAIVVFVHGGGYDAGTDRRDVIVNVADLVADGWPVLNVDYRGNGDGGGWDATFTDVATAVDQAAEAAERWGLAADRVAIVGHSAGGHLALWAAARHTLAAGDPGAGPRVVPAVAASMAGVLHPTALAFTDDNVRTVFGGTPAEVDDRYAIGDPARRVPLGMQLLVVHGTGDDTVPFSQAQEFTDAARAAGESVDLQLLDGVSHVDPLDPDGQSWPLVKRFLENSLG